MSPSKNAGQKWGHSELLWVAAQLTHQENQNVPLSSTQENSQIVLLARIEGAHSDRAASASRKDSLAAPLIFLRSPATSFRDGG